MCITTNQLHSISNPNPNPTIKQHTIASIRVNTVTTCHTCPERFIRGNGIALFLLLSVVTITLLQKFPIFTQKRQCLQWPYNVSFHETHRQAERRYQHDHSLAGRMCTCTKCTPTHSLQFSFY